MITQLNLENSSGEIIHPQPQVLPENCNPEDAPFVPDLVSRILWDALERISRLWWWTSPDPDWGWHDRINAAARRARENGSTIQLRSLVQLWEAHETKRISQFIDSLRPQATAWLAGAQRECGQLINRYELLGQSHEAAVQRAFDEIARRLSKDDNISVASAVPAPN